MAEATKTRITGLTVSTAVVATALTQAFIGYFSGNVNVTGNLNVDATASGTTIVSGDHTATGSGYVTIVGGTGTGTGGVLCLEDEDGAGYSAVTSLNGTLSTRAAAANECPTG